MWIIEKQLAENWNNYWKFTNLTKRWYEFRKYYIDEKTWFAYLWNAIKKDSMKWIKYRCFKWKTVCETIQEYNQQFHKIDEMKSNKK